jgi:hypothetical protein
MIVKSVTSGYIIAYPPADYNTLSKPTRGLIEYIFENSALFPSCIFTRFSNCEIPIITCCMEQRINDFDGWVNFSYNQAAGIIPLGKVVP